MKTTLEEVCQKLCLLEICLESIQENTEEFMERTNSAEGHFNEINETVYKLIERVRLNEGKFKFLKKQLSKQLEIDAISMKKIIEVVDAFNERVFSLEKKIEELKK